MIGMIRVQLKEVAVMLENRKILVRTRRHAGKIRKNIVLISRALAF